jgi:HAD superfamily hydrolase (TIGR01450 family)
LFVRTRFTPSDSVASAYDAILLDLDGTVYVGDRPTPGASEVIATLRASGKHILFLTNDPRFGPAKFVEKLAGFGIAAKEAEMLPVARAVAEALVARGLVGRTACVIGNPLMAAEVAAVGLTVLDGDAAAEAEVVVVGTDDSIGYHDLRRAATAARRGGPFFAANRDPHFPMPGGPWPGNGAILAAVEVASERRAEVIGKPERGMFEAALRLLPPEARCLMVGDRLDADVIGGTEAGMATAVVLTGTTRREDLAGAVPRPTYVLDDLRGLLDRPGDAG